MYCMCNIPYFLLLGAGKRVRELVDISFLPGDLS
jgi:hypothetical protein